MRRPRSVRLLILFLALGVVVAGCSSKKTASPTSPASPSGEESGGTMTIGSDRANDHGTKDVSGQDETDVELDNFYFGPTVLKGMAGQKVKLELENEAAGTLHNFTLQDQNIDMDVQSGQKAEVTVTLPQTGFLEFFCKYHKASGMVGELTV